MPVKVMGGLAIRRRITLIGREFSRKLERSGEKQANKVMKRSQKEFVPILSGALRDTGRVEKITRAFGLKVLGWQLLYGGINGVNYAVKQHEDLTLRHPHGGPKYLERPLLEAAKTIAADLGREARLG